VLSSLHHNWDHVQHKRMRTQLSHLNTIRFAFCCFQVLSSSHHNWDHVPEPFCRQLRQPLCLALLRNCATSDPVAYALALRLLVALLCLPRLRAGLRAELGAFYPLLVLRCLEQQSQLLGQAQQQPTEREQLQQQQANVIAALGALQGLLVEPQLLVDLFVNFDCDLQASNLYERTVQVG
jgi:brefeldin A-inhibited guanine nucleotide-exchange protein